jgi:hypothetical protein
MATLFVFWTRLAPTGTYLWIAMECDITGVSSSSSSVIAISTDGVYQTTGSIIREKVAVMSVG